MDLKEIPSKSIYYDARETITQEERENILFKDISKRLKKIVKLSKGWSDILKGINLNKINSRKDLSSLPITRKSFLTNLQKKNLPYGNLTIKHPNHFPYKFASPGPIYEPGDTNDFWNMSRSLYAAGLRKGDVVYNTFSYHLGPAGIMMHHAANRLGCPVIAGGVGNTQLQVQTINDLAPTFYIGTPSFLKVILENARENKIDISSLKKGLVGAEPFPNSLREIFAENDIDVLQMYGIAEVGCIAYETTDKNRSLVKGMVIEEDTILEIVRPGTLNALPLGEVGEIVVTKINSDYPMIRLATGDLSKIISSPSPCGRTNFRIHGWMGRAEQSTKFKGIFVTPNQINEVSKEFSQIKKTKLVITSRDYLDYGELFCETRIQDEKLKLKIKEFFKANFKLNINVSFVKKEDIPNDGIVIEDKRSSE